MSSRGVSPSSKKVRAIAKLAIVGSSLVGALSPKSTKRSHQSSSALSDDDLGLLDEIARLFSARITTKTHRLGRQDFKNSFSGEDAVTLLTSIVGSDIRAESVVIGSELQRIGVFRHVLFDGAFEDSGSVLYQLTSPISTPSSAPILPVPKPIAPPRENLKLLSVDFGPSIGNFSFDEFVQGVEREDGKLSRESRQRMPALVGRLRSLLRLAEGQKLDATWSESVPQSVLLSISSDERIRQEAIFELVKVQREFVEDLRNVKKFYMDELRQQSIIEPERLRAFMRNVFRNIDGDLLDWNAALSEAMERRQRSSLLVERVGDVFLSPIGTKSLEAFREYGRAQFYSRWWVKRERLQNSSFDSFAEMRSRLPIFRRLPLESYLTRPSAHLAHLPLIFEVILKRTPNHHPDRIDLADALKKVRDCLSEINFVTGELTNLNEEPVGHHVIFQRNATQRLEEIFGESLSYSESPKSGLDLTLRPSYLPRTITDHDLTSRSHVGTFGVPLEDLVERTGETVMIKTDSGYCGVTVPAVVAECVRHIRRKDMRVEHAFRKSGNIRRLKRITEILDDNPDAFECLVEESVIQLAALLKKFLRELPEPLMTFKLYRWFTASQLFDDREMQFQIIHYTFYLLPKANRDLLHFLSHTLRDVANAALNSGGAELALSNLATVIGPNVLFAKHHDPTEYDSAATAVFRTILERQEDLIIIPGDLYPEPARPSSINTTRSVSSADSASQVVLPYRKRIAERGFIESNLGRRTAMTV
ncbi:RhoGAP-domain-containing protein [Gonapodya prolifera JEL478]|uniref:RhoGAP-domain-containing protein n=1 Tax=Gonapodya prolifera (strain JEL478) TaxID=1344416 RepID=A0A139AFG8_GONPJ|nr:RhoGAP-domain-containing protein [Gonapodya prolifera JEL478]|eukprot:KXS15165.1 RhoGAP-domain-containing protein [Gonapodya prolifera JEL478]